MKRITQVGLVIVLIFGLTGCGQANKGSSTNDTETVSNTTGNSESESLTDAEGTSDTEGSTSTEESTDTEGSIDTEEPIEPKPLPEDNDVLIRVRDYVPAIVQGLRYNTVNNFTGKIIYDFDDAYLRCGTVRKLAKASEELAKHGLAIKIWDAYRPVEAQAALWEICPDPNFVSDPKTGTRAHCKGSAVDITLVDLKTKKEVEMPSDFDEFSAKGDRDYSDCSKEAAKNAKLLEDVMKACGFTPYSKEWWHFSDTDSYPVEEFFVPGTPKVWYANCEEYIGIRVEADSAAEVIGNIAAGEQMELIGWKGRFALINYKDKQGYVMSSYIRPVEEDYLQENIDLVEITAVYSYERMMQDVEALQKKYPKLIETEIIGKSELGRDIPVIRIGKENAKYHVLLQGAIHGREHLTAWVLMAMVDYWADNDIMAYGDVCYHIIPMSNPDGVVISQTETLDEKQQEIYTSDRRKGYTTDGKGRYASRWKANGLGVDINRNFSSGWDKWEGKKAPSSDGYRGTEPFSTAEAKVLRDYTLRYEFDATISYHAMGSLIYHGYGTSGEENIQSEDLAQALKEVTGYYLMGANNGQSAGYKDWAVDELKIPSVTIEIGCQEAPLAERELYSLFARHYRVLPALARWVQE